MEQEMKDSGEILTPAAQTDQLFGFGGNLTSG
jgi:hypothetical protein